MTIDKLTKKEIKVKLLVGVIGAIAIPAFIESLPRLESKLEEVFGWRKPATVIYQVREQEAEKYTPPRPISDNPHHYIPKPK